MKDFAGKVAVITGAGRGIGRGIALRCAQEKMKIVLAGIGIDSLTKTEADLKGLGAETLIVQTDVSLLANIENLAEKAYERFGVVDLLVNNAGVNARSKIIESEMADWDWVMGVNFFGVLYGVKTFVPRMIKQETPSHVVNVSSACGVVDGIVCAGSYGVSKHAVLALSEGLYGELAEIAPQVKVSAYCPGLVASEFYRVEESRPERFKENVTLMTAAQRKADEARFATGFPIEKSADILFDGLMQNKLYIGPKAFLEMHPTMDQQINQRAQNIIHERNPDMNSDE